MDRFEDFAFECEAIISCDECDMDEAMEIAITPKGKKLKQVKTDLTVDQMIGIFIKGMEKAGVKFASGAIAGKKLNAHIRRKDYLIGKGRTISGLGKQYTTIMVGNTPVVVYGGHGDIRRKFWVPIEKKNGRIKVVTIHTRQMAMCFNDDNSNLDQEKVKTYARKLLKYVEESSDSPNDDTDE